MEEILNDPPQVGEIMRAAVWKAVPSESLDEAAALMKEKKIHHMPVVEEGNVVGVVSRRDIDVMIGAKGILSQLADLIEIRHVMSSPAITIPPETTFREAIRLMMKHHVHSLPIVEQGDLVGIITETDFLNYLVASLEFET
ncbi:MAG: CBS domain-containing protein [Planctomycetota bacterium]|jgi:acetoin utilization protein AcuB|nr:CBS domain-containing protein [Planctomycetota bacterium]MDP7135055.1 CBS domain-containing protein [Planctomycetota bacterium]MDP7252089.1 CBS domain-containing protein [Planctomycetota bacterium]